MFIESLLFQVLMLDVQDTVMDQTGIVPPLKELRVE